MMNEYAHWHITIDPQFDDDVKKYLKEARDNRVYLKLSQLVVLAVSRYMKDNPAKED